MNTKLALIMNIAAAVFAIGFFVSVPFHGGFIDVT